MKHIKEPEEENKSKFMLRPCKVVLHDIALNNELLSFYLQKKSVTNEETKQVSYSHTSNSSNNFCPNIKCKEKKVEKITQKENVTINKRSNCKRRKKKCESECSDDMNEYDTHNISINTNSIRNKILAIREKYNSIIRSSEKRKNRVSSSEQVVNEYVHNMLIHINYNNTNELIATSDKDDTVTNTFGQKKGIASVDRRTIDDHAYSAPKDNTIYGNKNNVASKEPESINVYKKKRRLILDKEDTDDYIYMPVNASYDNANKIIMTKKHNDSIISLSQNKSDKVSLGGIPVEYHKISEINDMNKRSVKSMPNDAKCLKKHPTFLDCNNKVQVKCSIPFNNCSFPFAKQLQMSSNIRIDHKLSQNDIIRATRCVVKLQRIDIDSYRKNLSANVPNIDLGNSSSIRPATNIKTAVRTKLNNKYTSLTVDNTLKTSKAKPKINHIDEVVSKSLEVFTTPAKEKTVLLLAESNILSKQSERIAQLKRKSHTIEDSYCEQDSMKKINDNVKQTFHINENADKAANIVAEESEYPSSEKIKSHNILNIKSILESNNTSNLRVESTVNKSTLDFTDVNKIHESDRSISVNETAKIQTEYKRSVDNVKDSGSKRIKLNRHTPLDTDRSDLRKTLEEKRKLRQMQKLENISSIMYKYNEKDISVSEQIKVNNTYNTISMDTSDINDKQDVTEPNGAEIETNLSCGDNTPNIFTIVHENRDTCDNNNIREQYENSDVGDKQQISDDSNNNNNDNNDYNDNDDDDCISLYANETFDESLEDPIVHEEDNINKPNVNSNVYEMSDNSFDNFVKHNTREFNKEYANNRIGTTETLNRLNETENIPNVQQQQISRTIKTKLLPNEVSKVFQGYCYLLLKKNCCRIPTCLYDHNMTRLTLTISQKPFRTIVEIIRYAIQPLCFTYFSEKLYFCFLKQLTVEEILTFFYLFFDSKNCFTISPENIRNIIAELITNRKMSLKVIVDCIVAYMPMKRLNELYTILKVVTQLTKPAEYWNTLRTLYIALVPDKFVIHQILVNCIEHRHLHNVTDINKYLKTLDPVFVSKLDRNLLEKFRSLSTEKNKTNSSSPTFDVAVSDHCFERDENNTETIASPDPCYTVHTDVSESDILSCDDISTNNTDTNGIKRTEANNGDRSYALKPIDKCCLPEPRSVFRYHEHCWKFYLDLDRLRMGLHQRDYNYVINVLKFYVDEQAVDKIFSRTCEILRNEVKSRSGHHDHVKNLLQLAVQRDVFGILGTLLFDLGLAVVASLVDEEAWGLAHRVIHSLNVYDFPFTAAFYLLSAEIYLANKNPVEALNLLKTQNIICTSRSRWYVKSINDDEDIRNQIMHILLDMLLCNEYLGHAFFLFRFLVIDQASQYYPIDLSRYVDRLIVLSLSKKDTVLIKEISTLTLNYTFALNATTCRALTSTVIHIDEALARKIYNYAKNIGVYSALKLWPVISVILDTDLTEEEIYVIVLQLLKDLLLNLGHALEYVKYPEVKVFLVLESKPLDKRFYCAKMQKCNDTVYKTAKQAVREVLKKRFNPPLLLMSSADRKICRIQSKSLIDHLKAMYCS